VFDNSPTTQINISSDTIIELKDIGKSILKGRDIQSIDVKHINQFIDSVMVEDSIQRQFYFQVLNKICKEIKNNESLIFVEWQMLSFSKNYPNDFFKLSDSDLEYYSKLTGETFLSQEEFPLDRATDYLNNIGNELDSIYLNKFDSYSKRVFSSINDRK
jgi:hypothetical protein